MTRQFLVVGEASHGARRRGLAAGLSTAAHAVVLAAVLWLAQHPRTTPGAPPGTREPLHLVWLVEPGPAGGGGGGGNRTPAPARPAEREGRDRLTVPPQLQPVAPTEAPEPKPPEPTTDVPAKPVALGSQSLPGAIEQAAPNVDDVRGPGSGGGADSGRGTGSGPGDGPGLGPGRGGNTGGGYRAGNGVTSPTLVLRVPPEYTADAMRARMQGIVVLECVVQPNGQCSDVRIVRSLDRAFGLDQKAIDAALKWRFRPGLRLGEPVPVFVTLEMEFAIR